MIRELPMIREPFAFADDIFTSRPSATSEREVQAFYDAHANAATKVRALKWLVAALLLSIGFAAWTDGSGYAGGPNDTSMPAAAGPYDDAAARDTVKPKASASPLTIFTDGPTGFVFVYTAEGWKFVPSTGAGK